MRNLLISISLIVLGFASNLNAQTIEWERTYRGNADGVAYAVKETIDQGFILVGNESVEDSIGPWLRKTNSIGEQVGDLRYGSGNWNSAIYSLSITSDGGFVLTGFIESPFYNSTDLWLVRTNSSSDTLWTRTYGGMGSDIGYSVKETFDGGFIVVGQGASIVDSSDKDIWLIKTNSMGDTSWTRFYGNDSSSTEIGHEVIQTSDGGFIFIAESDSLTGGLFRKGIVLVKTNAAGDLLWQNGWGGNDILNQAKGYALDETNDGGYILGGKMSGGEGGWIIRTDDFGQKEWDVIYEEGAVYSIEQTIDNGFIFGGDSILTRTDSTGNTLWTKTFSVNIYSVLQADNGSYILAGQKGGDAWLAKIVVNPVTVITVDPVWKDIDDDGFAEGILDGSGSYHIENVPIVSYIWFDFDNWSVIGTDSIITVSLSRGNHSIGLIVVDGNRNGESDTTQFNISVVLGELPTPIITAESQWKDITGDGFAQGTLNASNSSHPAGFAITGFEWTLNDSVLGTVAQITASLPRGTNSVKLTVTDENGLSNSTTKNITVILGDLPTPVITAESEWKDIDDDGFAQGNLDASSSTHPAGYAITGFEWSLNDSVLGTTAQITASLPTGTNQVILTVTDINGLSNSTTKSISVVLGELPSPVITAESQWKDITGDGFAQGTLNASSSTHPAGYALTGFEWTLNDSVLGNFAQITAFLPRGTNSVKLTVTDENGLSNSTTQDITVTLGELPTPVIDAAELWGLIRMRMEAVRERLTVLQALTLRVTLLSITSGGIEGRPSAVKA